MFFSLFHRQLSLCQIKKTIYKPQKLNQMKKFRVYAKMTEWLYLDVEAESKEKAIYLAEVEDGAFFTSEQIGDWEIQDAEEIESKNNS